MTIIATLPSAALKMNVDDYYRDGSLWRLRLYEKNGEVIKMAAHHITKESLDGAVKLRRSRSIVVQPDLRVAFRQAHETRCHEANARARNSR